MTRWKGEVVPLELYESELEAAVLSVAHGSDVLGSLRASIL